MRATSRALSRRIRVERRHMGYRSEPELPRGSHIKTRTLSCYTDRALSRTMDRVLRGITGRVRGNTWGRVRRDLHTFDSVTLPLLIKNIIHYTNSTLTSKEKRESQT